MTVQGSRTQAVVRAVGAALPSLWRGSGRLVQPGRWHLRPPHQGARRTCKGWEVIEHQGVQSWVKMTRLVTIAFLVFFTPY